jgi:hypothetical protein
LIHAIRLGTHAEKEYLLRAAPWFTEVVLNANLVEATAGASSVFVVSLAKPYVIDPVTYAFGQNPYHLMNVRRGDIKRTFRALGERFGEPVATCLAQGRALQPGDFSSVATVEGFCSRVLGYQVGRVGEALEANEVFLEPGLEGFPPVRLISPYFYNDETVGWLDVNRRLADASVEGGSGTEVWAVVSFDGLLLDRREDIDKLAESYGSVGCSGFLFWPADFEETRATMGQIVGLRRLVASLCSVGRSGIMLYGGYFSALLQDEGMAGISHGVGYGEKRDVVPVLGGGLPPAKYYLRAIHDDIYIHEMLQVAEELDERTFQSEICDCTICSGVIARGGLQLLRDEFGATEERPYGGGFRSAPTGRVYRLTRFHYLENKHRELAEIAAGDRPSLVQRLGEGYDRFSSYLGHGRLGYLIRWRQGLLEAVG